MPLANFIIAPIAAAVIFIEWIILCREHSDKQKLNGTRMNIMVGLIFSLFGLLSHGLIVYFLNGMKAFSFFDFGNFSFRWIVIFILLDLIHYFIHYLEHNVRFLWAIHSVHHSSEIYNFSTAIRGPLGIAIYKILYVVPLTLVGFDVFDVLIVDQVMLVYGIFVHTEYVRKLGVLEYFMNTPSHHRVHHGRNEEYLDKNYGVCLIIWDRLFGTFKLETSKPVYGLTKPVISTNPVKIIMHEWMSIVNDIITSGSMLSGFRILFSKPGWTPKIQVNRMPFSRKIHNGLRGQYHPTRP